MSKIDRYENVKATIEGDELVIRCKIDENVVDAQPSKSGKTVVLATSGGAIRIPGTELRLNLTLYRKP